MAILYNKIERANLQNPLAPKKWHPLIKTINRIEEKDVAKEIADETTLNRNEAEMALAQLEKVLINNLLAGNSLQIGDWGSFHLTCKSVGSATKEEVTAKNIKKLNIRFKAGKSLLQALEHAIFLPAESMVTK